MSTEIQLRFECPECSNDILTEQWTDCTIDVRQEVRMVDGKLTTFDTCDDPYPVQYGKLAFYYCENCGFAMPTLEDVRPYLHEAC